MFSWQRQFLELKTLIKCMIEFEPHCIQVSTFQFLLIDTCHSLFLNVMDLTLANEH